MEIIPYSDKYKEQVIKLVFDIAEKEFGRHSKSGRLDLYNITQVYQANKGNFWVAVENGEVIGAIALKNMGKSRGDLWRFYIRKEMRRLGIGKKLFFTLLKFARKNAYKKIFISTWSGYEGAHNFYVEHGFLRIKSLPKDFQQSPGDNVFYELKL